MIFTPENNKKLQKPEPLSEREKAKQAAANTITASAAGLALIFGTLGGMTLYIKQAINKHAKNLATQMGITPEEAQKIAYKSFLNDEKARGDFLKSYKSSGLHYALKAAPFILAGWALYKYNRNKSAQESPLAPKQIDENNQQPESIDRSASYAWQHKVTAPDISERARLL